MASILLMSVLALVALAIAIVPVIVILARPTAAETRSTSPAVLPTHADTADDWAVAA